LTSIVECCDVVELMGGLTVDWLILRIKFLVLKYHTSAKSFVDILYKFEPKIELDLSNNFKPKIA
jgi:hypothetical protein